MMDAWANVMGAWMAASKRAKQEGWSERYYSAPIWRFAVGRGQISSECWVGLAAASVDAVGREFPFSVMWSVDLDLMTSRPFRLLDLQLDALERPMLSFIEGKLGKDAFLAEVDHTANPIPLDVPNPDHDDVAGFILPRGQDDGVCLSFDKMEDGTLEFTNAFSSPPRKTPVDDKALCLWWHDECVDRQGEICVTKSLPSVVDSAPYFLGSWEAHGWSRECLEDYIDGQSD